MEENMTGNNEQKKNKKFVIIHGHFYQPPRENPWLDIIETQPSASPDHDWNERIYNQCYRPNAYSRLLDAQGMISDIYNNYESMSFNFGPTLYSWLESRHPLTAKRIADADVASCKRFNGHGNAVAQVYNHIIMPLALERDQLTQIRWSKYFFNKRFNRDPEGMWLAETAINMETVMCLIRENIKFVVLSPNQAEAFRSLNGNADWVSTGNGIDIRRPYRVMPRDHSGKKLMDGYLDVFFFDEGLSKEASFGDLLKDSSVFGNRVNACYDGSYGGQVVTLATDGETFGHHKPFGDMCLAYFFKKVAPQLGIEPVNFAYYLELNPPQFEIRLKNAYGEGTAWSCAHGVGRWSRDCGCKTGGEDHWKQGWRGPLRTAFENLQKKIDKYYIEQVSDFIPEPYALRDLYCSIDFQNSSWTALKELLERKFGIVVDKEQTFIYRRLLEAQKYMLFSFTSCAWFFSEISGIEAIQNMAYACRALQMGIPPEHQTEVLEMFLKDLDNAKSNLANTTGRSLFERHILHFMDHQKILAFTAAVQWALSIQEDLSFELYGYKFQVEHIMKQHPGLLTYDGFIVRMEHEGYGETAVFPVLISHRDYAEVTGWVIPSTDVAKMKKELPRPEQWMGYPEAKQYTLMDMFDISREDLEEFVLEKIATDTADKFTTWMKKNEKELDFISRLNIPIPSYCTAPMSYVFQEEWVRACRNMAVSGTEDEVFTELLEMTRMATRFNIQIDMKKCASILEGLLVDELTNLADILQADRCDRVRYLLNIVDRFKVPVSKHRLEDIFNSVLTGQVTELYKELITAKNNKESVIDDGRKELFIKLISFARRMNFNTDTLQI
jgi:alpha-amylase/alpha-mannosidase (GH57 family)